MAKTSSELIQATQRFNELFEKIGIKVDPFEKAIGVSQGTIKSVRNGRNFLSADCIIKIAKYLNISADYLLCLTDDPRPLESHEVGKTISSVPTIFGQMPDLFKEQRLLNTIKIYNELPDEFREKAFSIIMGIAVGLGISVENILRR